MGGEVLKAQYTHPVSGVTTMVPVKCGTDGSLAVTGGGGVATDVKPCNDGITQLPILSDAAGQIYIGHDGVNEQLLLTDNTGALILASGVNSMVCDDPLAGGPYYVLSDVNGQIYMAHDGVNPQLLLSDANGVLYLGWDGAAATKLKTDAAGKLETVGGGTSMICDDIGAGGPYYALSDVNGQILIGNDGANALALKTDAGGALQIDVEGPLGSQLEAASVSIAPPTDARFQVSKDANTNAEGNPIFVRISDSINSADVVAAGADNEANAIKGLVTYSRLMGFDGATWDRAGITAGAMDTYITGPLGSAIGANSLSTAPASDARYQVSKDANVNATANRLWVTSDIDMIGGIAVNVNGGNRDAGTQTVTLADNDLAVIAVETIENAVHQDDAVFTAGVDGVMATGLMFDDVTPDSVGENDIGIPRMSANRNAYTTIRDAAGNERGVNVTAGNAMQTDIAEQSLTAVKVSADAASNAVGNPIHVELSDGAAAFLDNTAAPGYIRLQDGDSTVLADILDDLPTSTLAGTTNSLACTSLMIGYDYVDSFRPLAVGTDGQLAVGTDGANHTVLKTDVNGQLYVLQGALLPGEDDGNDWRKVKKEEIGTYSPAKTGPTAVDETPDIILASVEVLSFPNFTIWVKNVGGGTGNALTDVDVQVSPDSANWVSVTSTACDTLTSGQTGIAAEPSGNSARYVRVYAQCGAGDDTTVDCWITANKG